ncbi:MAG: hypothetical protein V4620_04800 [Bacteroidota bacterium]
MQQSNSIYKLTALWAFTECSLGGLMHLFKIPFTGFFVGGFAVIMIGLIAYFSKQNFRTILQATILVILVKAAVSPQSPPPAYFAVLFQGFFGAVIFGGMGFNRFSAMLFGAVAMVESSLQMIISKTIFYGMDFWKAIDLLFQNILKDFGLSTTLSFSFWLIFLYVLLYAIWGLLLGFWCSQLPFKLTDKWELITPRLQTIHNTAIPTPKQGPYRKLKWLGVVFTLLFIITVLLMNGEQIGKAWFIVLRTILVVSILYFVVAPLIQYIIKRFSADRQTQINAIVNDLPAIKQTALLAYTLASENKKGFAKYREFVWILITLTLYHED